MTRALVLLTAFAVAHVLPATSPVRAYAPEPVQQVPAPAPPVQEPVPPPADAAPGAIEDPDAATADEGDPAAVGFVTDAGVLLVTIKAAEVAAYEAAIAALHEAFHESTDPEERRMAEGWVVFKAAETDAMGNAVYVHMIRPTVEGGDYRPSRRLDTLLQAPPDELLSAYRDAFAAPPTKLSLSVLADFAAEPPPANVSPDGPDAPAPPAGNGTPGAPSRRGPPVR